MIGAVGFFLPTLLTGIDYLASHLFAGLHLPGRLIYLALAGAALITAAVVLTAPIRWFLKPVLVVIFWSLLAEQVAVLGLVPLALGDLEGIQ